MADGWYLFDGTKRLGPLPLNELRRLLQAQRLPDAQVWHPGLTQWFVPSELPELSGMAMPPVPAGSDDTPDQITGETIARAHNFIAANWRGEFSLATAYWIFGFLGNLFAGVLAVVVIAAFQSNTGYEPRAIFFMVLLLWTGMIAIAIWQVVGVWRSANRYRRERAIVGKRSPWAALAKLAMVVGVIRLAATFFSSGWPQLLEVSRMLFLNDPDIPAYSMRIMRNGTEAEITGGFKYGLTDDFANLLKASPRIRVLHLDSLGGRIGEAEKLNKLITSNHLDTYVSSNCMSACTLAFAGGVHRILRQGAVLGFHAPSYPGTSQQELAGGIEIQRDVYLAAGFDQKFIDHALATPTSELWRPSLNALLGAKAITAVSDGNDFAMSGMGTSPTRDDFGRILSRGLPLMEPLKSRFPNDYDAVVEAYYSGYVSDKTEGESRAAVGVALMGVLRRLRPLADDSVLLQFGPLLADQYSSLGAQSPELCYRYVTGTGKPVTPADLPQALTQRVNDLDRLVVETASTRAATDAAVSTAIWRKVLAMMTGQGVSKQQLDLMFAANAPAETYGDYCAAWTILFREVGKLPPSEAGIIMRPIIAGK